MSSVLISVERRLVFATMGTVASLATAADLPPATGEALRAVFDEFEDRFSLFRPESEASRVHRGELALRDASRQYRDAWGRAHDWGLSTGGAFDPHPPGGGIDLTGLVKALAIAAGGELLDAHSVCDWCLNVGGDVLVCGEAASGRPWTAGIVDPRNRGELVSQFTLSGPRRAVATSGTSERGDHIWRRNNDFLQVSVVADDIETADVLATAIIAGGRGTLDDVLFDHDVEVLAINATGVPLATAGFAAGWPNPAP